MLFPKDDEEPRRAALRRREAPRRQIVRSVRRIPRTRPGKKPTRTAPAGKLLQVAVIGIVELLWVEEDVGAEDAEVALLVEEKVGDVVAEVLEEEDVGVELGEEDELVTGAFD